MSSSHLGKTQKLSIIWLRQNVITYFMTDLIFWCPKHKEVWLLDINSHTIQNTPFMYLFQTTEHNRSRRCQSECEQVNVISSAWAWADDDKDNVNRSLMNIKNRVGASNERCRTPTVIGKTLDTWFEKPTNCLLSTKKDLRSCKDEPSILKFLSFWYKIWWSTQSNALKKSKNMFLLFISNIW